MQIHRATRGTWEHDHPQQALLNCESTEERCTLYRKCCSFSLSLDKKSILTDCEPKITHAHHSTLLQQNT
jgi:hypothetical protein